MRSGRGLLGYLLALYKMREGSRIINYWAEHLKGGLLEPDYHYIMTLTIMRPNQEQPGHEKIANTKRKIPRLLSHEHETEFSLDVEMEKVRRYVFYLSL